MEIQDIQHILTHVIETWKPYNPDTLKGKKAVEKGELPPYYPTYIPSVEYYNEIRTHAEKGVFPHRLFSERSPNQTNEEYEYQMKNYRQKTLPVYMDFLNVVLRAFNDGNYSVDFPNDGDNPMQEYVNNLPKYGSLDEYMRNIVTNVKLKDSNGVIAVKPKYVPRDEETGQFLNGEEIEVLPCYYKSKQVVYRVEGETYMIELPEHSMVKYAGKTQPKGKVYELYDKNTIYRIEQKGDYTDFEFDIYEYFNHEIGECPVFVLGGIEQIMYNDVVYQSPFLYAVDCLDLAALNYSNLQLSINNCVYPYRVMIGNICDFEDNTGARCDGGVVYSNDGTVHTCTKCNGTGLRSRLSPLGTMLIKPPSPDEPAGETGITTPMQFISPPTDALQFLSDQADKNINKAREILHIKDTTDQATGDETATGLAIEQKQMYSFVKPISDGLFKLYGKIMDAMGYMRYGERYESMQPTIVAPITFDYLTHEDYLVLITQAVEAGLPPFIVQPLVLKYLKTLFYNDGDVAAAFKLIVKTDRLLMLPPDVISKKLAIGTADKYEEIIHDSGAQLIIDLIEENPAFWELGFKEQQTALIDRAKAVADEIKANKPQPLNTDELVNRMTNPGGGDE